MNMKMLNTIVTAVPTSVIQRSASSKPPMGAHKALALRGKTMRSSANRLGTKMTADISHRSYCIVSMNAYSDSFRLSRRDAADEVGQQREHPHERQDQEQHVTANVARLHVAQPLTDGIDHVG